MYSFWPSGGLVLASREQASAPAGSASMTTPPLASAGDEQSSSSPTNTSTSFEFCDLSQSASLFATPPPPVAVRGSHVSCGVVDVRA